MSPSCTARRDSARGQRRNIAKTLLLTAFFKGDDKNLCNGHKVTTMGQTFTFTWGITTHLHPEITAFISLSILDLRRSRSERTRCSRQRHKITFLSLSVDPRCNTPPSSEEIAHARCNRSSHLSSQATYIIYTQNTHYPQLSG